MSRRKLTAWRARASDSCSRPHNLIHVLTAYRNVEPAAAADLAPSREERRDHAEAALRLVGLPDRMHHFPRQLSGGQEQRVAIARAIASDLDVPAWRRAHR